MAIFPAEDPPLPNLHPLLAPPSKSPEISQTSIGNLLHYSVGSLQEFLFVPTLRAPELCLYSTSFFSLKYPHMPKCYVMWCRELPWSRKKTACFAQAESFPAHTRDSGSGDH